MRSTHCSWNSLWWRKETVAQLRDDLAAAVAYLHRAPVRLMGDQAIGLQQVTHQALFHHLFTGGVQQVVGVELIIVDADILLVDAMPAVRAIGVPSSCSTLNRVTLTSPRAQADRSRCRCCAPFPIGERAWLKLLRYSLKLFDSIRFRLSALRLISPTATCGKPLAFSQRARTASRCPRRGRAGYRDTSPAARGSCCAAPPAAAWRRSDRGRAVGLPSVSPDRASVVLI